MRLTSDQLSISLARLLEDATFLFTEPAAATSTSFVTEAIEATVQYGGAGAGEVRIVTGVPVAATLAANLLGIDDAASPEARARAGDAIGEAVNMWAGALVLVLFGGDALCSISVPKVRSVPAGSLAPVPEDTVVATLRTERGELIVATLRYNTPPSAKE